MKNLRNLFALLIFTVVFYSCDSTVTIDDPNSETVEVIDTKTGDEGNETEGRCDPDIDEDCEDN